LHVDILGEPDVPSPKVMLYESFAFRGPVENETASGAAPDCGVAMKVELGVPPTVMAAVPTVAPLLVSVAV
jgi:hypothetical protein